MTSEMLVRILGNAIGAGTIEGDTVLLTSLIRAPDDLLAAMSEHEQRTEELREDRALEVLAAVSSAAAPLSGPGPGGGRSRARPAPRSS